MITSLEIARFKAIREASLALGSLNLFTGVNGMGKSSCLQALLLLRQSWLAKTLPTLGLLLRGSLVDLGRGEDVLHQFESEESIKFGIKTGSGEAEWIFDVGEGQGFDHEILSLRSLTQNYGNTAAVYSATPFAAGFKYLSAERVRPEVAYETSFYAVRELDQIGSRGEFAVHYLAEHQNRSLTIAGLRHPTLAAGQTDLLSNVCAWMGELSPGISLSVQQFPGIHKATVVYEYDTGPMARFANPIRPTNVGFGITYALPIVIATLSSREGDTLIIENPESHLHPRGQLQIGGMVALAAAAGVQVFIESHSDHVLNGVRLAVKNKLVSPEKVAVFSFDRPACDPNHDVKIVTPKIDENGKIDKWPAGFFNEAEKALYELL